MNTDPGMFQGVATFLLLAVVGCLILLNTKNNQATLRWQTRLFLFSFLIRFALSIGIYAFGLVSIVKDEDASGWIAGVDLVQQWQARGVSPLEFPFVAAEVFPQSRGGHLGYRYLLASWFYVTNSPFRLVAAALNCFFGAMTAVMAYRVARCAFSEWVSQRVGWWVALFPSMIIWSAMTIKEPIVIFMETCALYGCMRLGREGPQSLKHLLVCGAMLIFLLPFRFYAAYLVGIATLLALLIPSVPSLKTRMASLMLAVLVVPVVLGTGVIAQHQATVESFDIKYVQSFRTAVSVGGAKAGAGSGVQSTHDLSTGGGFAAATAIGAAHLALAPFPWQLGGASLRMVLTLPELVYWWWLFFVGVVPGFKLCLRYRFRDVLVILLFVAGFGLLYSVMFGNVGLVFRQRAQLLPWLFIFAAVGLEWRKTRREAQLLAPKGAVAQMPTLLSASK